MSVTEKINTVMACAARLARDAGADRVIQDEAAMRAKNNFLAGLTAAKAVEAGYKYSTILIQQKRGMA